MSKVNKPLQVGGGSHLDTGYNFEDYTVNPPADTRCFIHVDTPQIVINYDSYCITLFTCDPS